MKIQIRSVFILVIFLALSGWSRSATAMLTPQLGRFMQQDPLGEEQAVMLLAVRNESEISVAAFGIARASISRPHGGMAGNLRSVVMKYADGMNIYQFVWSNPITHQDPSGLAVAETGEKVIAVCECGVIAAKRAKALADEASAKAQQKYAGSLHNGDGDAFRHCYWSCKMRQDSWIGGTTVRVLRLGIDCAKLIGDIHELRGNLEGQPAEELYMDLLNNQFGRDIGSTGVDCEAGCDKAVKDGKLVTLR